MIHIHSYKEVCEAHFDWPDVTVLPKGKLVYVPLEQIDHFFKLCRENPSRSFVIVSANSDFGIFEQKEYPVNVDLYKRCDFAPWAEIYAAKQYCSFKVGPACEPERCKITDRYSIKTYAHTVSTFDEIPANVVHWFSVNVNIKHPRITCIPFGIGSAGHLKDIEKALLKRRQLSRDLLYVNFTNYTKERADLKEFYKVQKWATVRADISLAQYYTDLWNHEFILCPAGNGLDCYRMWEALLCGALPIVLKSTWSEHLADYFLSATSLILTEEGLRKLQPSIEYDKLFSNFQRKFNVEHYRQQMLDKVKLI